MFRIGTVSLLKTHEKFDRNHGATAKKNPAPFVGAGLQIGSPSRTRTSDPVVNSHLLYQLSYWGTSSLQKNQVRRKAMGLQVFYTPRRVIELTA